jgi:hypothetical protein
MKNVVLVHGGFVDGAGWKGVYQPFTLSIPARLFICQYMLAFSILGAWKQRMDGAPFRRRSVSHAPEQALWPVIGP